MLVNIKQTTSRRLLFKGSILCLLFILAFTVHAGVLQAHANYLRSIPEADSVNPITPTEVQVWFSEDLSMSASSLMVRDVHGDAVVNGMSESVPGDSKSMRISLRPLQPGIYTVIWTTVSADDGHEYQGSFAFSVGPAINPVSIAPLIELVERSTRSLELPPVGSLVVNLVTVISFIVLTGAITFRVLVLGRAELTALRQSLDTIYRRYLWICLAGAVFAVVLTTIAFILRAGVAALVGRYGIILLVRVLLVTGIAALIRSHNEGKVITLLPAAILLLTQSLLSHSAAETQWIAPVIADWVHLTFAALWLGGVAVLAIVIMSVPYNERERLKELGLAITRFSPLAMFSVIAIGISGVAQSASLVGSTDALFSTAYGRVLLIKAGLLIILVGSGIFHQQVIAPRLQEWRLRELPGAVGASQRFHRSILAESAVGLILLLAVAVLIGLPPGRDVAFNPTMPSVIDTRQSTGGNLQLTLGILPAAAGYNNFDLYARNRQDTPVLATEKVILRFKHDGVDTGESEVQLEPRGNGHYVAYTGNLSLIGDWQITAIVRRPEKADESAVFQVVLQP